MSTKISPTLDTLQSFLEKARKRLSDEDADTWENSDTDEAPEEDLSEEEGIPDDSSYDDEDSSNDWLEQHDPAAKKGAAAPASKEVAPAPPVQKKLVATPVAPVVRRKDTPTATAAVSDPASEDELQPSREELNRMREYTRPWEQNARDRARLEARPEVNPIKHHQGRIIEARNLGHADKQKAYEDFTSSPDYKNADPITQLEMDAKFHQDWHAQNPDHLKQVLQAHQVAHQKGSAAKDIFARAKDEKIRHVAGGGVQPGAFSVEEGLQHAGGGRDEEGEAPSGITQDRSAQFSAGNQEFLQNYMSNYNKRAKQYDSPADLDAYDNETRADIDRVLGEHPALKDPAKKAQVDAFIQKYHPLIRKAAQRVLSKMGLAEQGKSGQIDYGLLHEAGMHALFQAVNDYDHDHPSKAKFTTHLNRKMHGLMQTALKTQDEIPAEMRTGARRFDQKQRAVNAASVKHTDKFGNTRIINPGAGQASTPPPAPAAPAVPKPSSHELAAKHPPEVQDRLKRVAAAKQPLVRRAGTVPPKPPAAPQRKWNINVTNSDDEGGEE